MRSVGRRTSVIARSATNSAERTAEVAAIGAVRHLRGAAHTDWHLRWTQIALRPVAQTRLHAQTYIGMARRHGVNGPGKSVTWRKSSVVASR